MIAVDTSVVVAAFASWHEAHEGAARVLERRPRLPAHALVETYSVLTRLPPPHRAGGEIVSAFLVERFSRRLLTLSAEAHTSLIAMVATTGLAGGAIYDALIAATARDAGAVLMTRDRRALTTYERIGADCEFLD